MGEDITQLKAEILDLKTEIRRLTEVNESLYELLNRSRKLVLDVYNHQFNPDYLNIEIGDLELKARNHEIQEFINRVKKRQKILKEVA